MSEARRAVLRAIFAFVAPTAHYSPATDRVACATRLMSVAFYFSGPVNTGPFSFVPVAS